MGYKHVPCIYSISHKNYKLKLLLIISNSNLLIRVFVSVCIKANIFYPIHNLLIYFRQSKHPAQLLRYLISKFMTLVNTLTVRVYSIQHYVIKFVSGFLWILQFPPLIKLTTTIQLKYC